MNAPLHLRLARTVAAAAALVTFWILAAGRLPAQELSAPPVQILQNRGQLGDGLIFLSPQGDAQPDPEHPLAQGAEIMDNQGRVVWFNPVLGGVVRAMDFRVQTYQGKPVLTWTQGASYVISGVPTVDYIMDTSYNVVATVQAGNGLNAEQHDFTITPDNTALIVIYHLVNADLSSVGGPVNGKVYEGAVQEIDIATGRVLLEWHSLPDIPLTDSYARAPTATSTAPYDYIHLNSVTLDTDGNLLVSARHTWTVYKINRRTGQMMWRLGGKRSDFTLGPGLPFAWQHDAVAVDAHTIRIFDNESNGTPVLPYSRVLWVNHDEATMTASIVRSIEHPDGVSSAFMGDGQTLPNGNTFVGWGAPGRCSEFDPSGQLLFDAQLITGYNSYRAYRFKWTGMPDTKPTAKVIIDSMAGMEVHAIWNGATQVATWQVLGGSSPTSLGLLGSGAWDGLDTAINVGVHAAYVQVVALNLDGKPIGASAPIATPVAAGTPVITAAPLSQTVTAGSTLVLSAATDNTSDCTYQWYRDGNVINGATSCRLVIPAASAGDSGSYTVSATNVVGTALSGAATITISSVPVASRLGNLSILGNAGAAGQPLIAGFTVGGADTSGSTRLLVRATGPALTQFGATNVLPDPNLSLFKGTALLAANDNWNNAADGGSSVTTVGASVGAFPLSSADTLDSALVGSFAANNYSAVVDGHGGAGMSLIEVYQDASGDTANAPRLINLSCRGTVGSGADVLVAGFVVVGNTSKTVLIRGVGPSLRSFGISDPLDDPQLVLHRNVEGSDTVLGQNAGWNGDVTLQNAAASVGAFGLTDSDDAAMIMTLPPGAYTVELSSASRASGVALFEIYELP